MADTPTVASFDANAVAGLSAEQREAFAGQLIRNGYPAADARAKLKLGEPPAPHAPGAEPFKQPERTQVLTTPSDGISFDEKLRGYSALLKHAHNPEAVIAAAAREGIELKPDGTAEHKPSLTRDQQIAAASSASFTRPNEVPADPNGYHLSYNGATVDGLDPSELGAFDSELKAALHTASVPANLAQSILDGIEHSTGLIPENATDDQRKAIFAEQGAELRRTFGETGARELIELASAAYFRLPESFRSMVDAQWGFHSAQAQIALANIEREYQYRHARKS